MGLVFAEIKLINGDDCADFERGRIEEKNVRQMTVEMNIDSGAIMLAINENIREQLGLRIVEARSAVLADGTMTQLQVTAPIELRFANRRCASQALVLPGNAQPLLGAIPMEEMDLVIHPARHELTVHPDHPYVATMAMRGFLKVH